MSDMDKVDEFLAKAEELIEEVEGKGILRHVRTPQGMRRFSDPIGGAIEVNKPDKPVGRHAAPESRDAGRVALPPHKPLKPKHSATNMPPEPTFNVPESDYVPLPDKIDDVMNYKPGQHVTSPDGKRGIIRSVRPTFHGTGSTNMVDKNGGALEIDWEPIKASNKNVDLPDKLVSSLKDISPRGTPDGKGTPDDPIDVGDDIPLAAKHLAEGKSIRMKDNHAVATLIDELAKIGNEAREKGEKAPNYDLCKVSVPGTNLFCYEHKGIPRAQMPQFKGEAVPGSLADKKRKTDDLKEEVDVEDEFRAALDAMGVKITPKTVKASELKATQSELVGTKVAGMAKAMEAGKIKDAPIFVTRDGYIIDGHHRWAAKVTLDLKEGDLGEVQMPVNEIDMEIGEAIDFANLFAKIVGLAPKAAKTTLEGASNPGTVNTGKKSLGDSFVEWADESKTIADQACESGACGWNENTLLDAYMNKVEEVLG